MPARTYDFSNYQGGLESLESGVATGLTGMEALVHGLRRRRTVEQQQDTDEAIKQQTAVNADARANAEAGGGDAAPQNPVTAPGGPAGPSPVAGVRVGESFKVGAGTPPFAPSASPAATSPAAPSAPSAAPDVASAPDAAPASQPGGIMGRIQRVRQAAARLILGGADSAPGTSVPAPSFHRTGPSDAMRVEDTRAQAERDVAGITADATRYGDDQRAASSRYDADTQAAASRYDADQRLEGDRIRAAVERLGVERGYRTANVQGMQQLVAALNDRARSIQAELSDKTNLTKFANDPNPNAYGDWAAGARDDLSLVNDEMSAAAAGIASGGGPNPQLVNLVSHEQQLRDLMSQRRAALAQVTGNDPGAQQKRARIEQRYQQFRAQLLGAALATAPASPAPASHGGGSDF